MAELKEYILKLLEAQRQIMFTGGIGLMIAGIVCGIITYYVMTHGGYLLFIFPVIAIVGPIGSIYSLFSWANSKDPHNNEIYKTIFDNSKDLAWVYAVENVNKNTKAKTPISYTVHFVTKKPKDLTLIMTGEKDVIKLMALLKENLPHVDLEYSPEKASKYLRKQVG